MSQEVETLKRTSLLRAGSIVSCMTLCSRILGFIRDVLIAQLFGAAAGIDAFFVAFKIPNFMRRLFAEGAFSQAFVPVLAEYQEITSTDKLKLFIARISGNLFVVLLAVTVLAVLSSPYIVRGFAPGFDSDGPRFLLAASMLKITFPYLLLISMTALCGAVLNTFGRFAIPAITPVFLNISIILMATVFSKWFNPPVYALAFGVFVGGFVQLFFQIPFLYRANILVMPKVYWRDSGVRRVLKLMVPALFGVSVAQVNLLIDTVFASFLTVGSVSWLYYSDRLTFFPLGVFGVAIATVILPHLSREHVGKNESEYSKALDWAIRLVLLIALPSTIGLSIYAKPLLASLLAYGKFSNHDVLMTSRSLVTFSLGITGFMLVKVLASAFYATQNIKTPVKIAAIAMVANTSLCLILIKPLAHAGLALASSLASFLNALMLLVLLIRRGVYKPSKGWGKYTAQLVSANAWLALLLLYLRPQTEWVANNASTRISHLFFDISIASVVYVLGLFLCGVRIHQFRQVTNSA